MQAPFPSPFKVWHNDTYAAIDPTNPELSQASKTVIITGAGSGIGRAIAIAYAKAKASHLVLIGRTESTLKETQTLLPQGPTKVTIFVCSVTDEPRIRSIAEEIGRWDILILNAGRISTPGLIIDTSLTEWWDDFEVNVKSIALAAQAFIPKANPTNAAIYTIGSACFTLLPAKAVHGASGYLISKLAQIRLVECLAAQHPNLFICTVHPGIVKTKVFDRTGSNEQHMPMDKPELPANFVVWLSQPKTKFLHGKTVWVNWDVDELCQKAEEIQNSEIMTVSGSGWEFGWAK